ncbi:MAG: hypothetical protein L6R38_000415 [Xanthoria sp. 2 TBL-2021]|nr:MAG: hypothetical protein L6R38_000415 [Xanthoria sp. 2 TBL-2021]
MFREPAVEATKSIGKKGDPTAPTRSSIRRQRTVRYPAHSHRDRQSSRHAPSHHHDRPFVDALRVRDRARVVSTRFNAERALNIEIAADQAHAEASRQRRLESGRAILRDALSYEHTHQPITMRIDGPYPSSLMRPLSPSSASFRYPSRHLRHRPVVPEIGRDGSLSRTRAELTQSPPPAYIPSPPYTSPGRSHSSSPDDSQPANTAASLTPRFAPAHVLAQSEAREHPSFQHRQLGHEYATASDSMLEEFPPLHRVNRRHTPSRRDRGSSVHGDVDGLGDRWRSVSPDTDPWEILLSTMPPDERLPSTSASSFRSNEDLAPHEELGELAESMGNGMNSYPIICDNSDSDFTEAEDDAIVNVPGFDDSSSAHTHGRSTGILSASALSSGRTQRTLGPQLTGQPPASSPLAQSARNRRLQRHLDEVAMLTSNEGRSSGRPSRERL